MYRARHLLPAHGFSLLELLVAGLCTGLIAAAVFSLLVSGAAATRRRWAAVAAQSTADAVVAAVAADAREAGRGLEQGDSILLHGGRIPRLSPSENGGIRLLRALGPVLEVMSSRPGAIYEVAAAGDLEPGVVVAAIGLPDRPPSAPLPAGVVIAVFPRLSTLDVTVAWGSSATLLAGWGEPRALLALETREYETLRLDDGWRLQRRDGARRWQPVADGLTSFSIGWLMDMDADGAVDTRLDTLPVGNEDLVCGLVVEATVAPVEVRGAGTFPTSIGGSAWRAAASNALAEARRWVRTGRC